MPWFRLDDSFHSHPKVIAAGNEAIGLYVRCGTHAAEHLTDGFVSRQVVLSYGSSALAATLVRCRLWHRARGGWTIHDYLDFNPSREAVENERKAAAERQRRSRYRAGRDHSVTQEGYDDKPVDKSHRKEAPQVRGHLSRRDNAVTHGVSPPAPTRPDPTPKSKPTTAEAVNSNLEGTPPRIELPKDPWLGGSGQELPAATPAEEAERKRQMDALMREYPEVAQ